MIRLTARKPYRDIRMADRLHYHHSHHLSEVAGTEKMPAVVAEVRGLVRVRSESETSLVDNPD